ncbi:MAG: hypothetical protein AB2825_18795 [Candidatus Thiodiazotropha endolucinida]
MTTLQQALQSAQQTLSTLPGVNSELEAALLLCHILDKPRSYLYAWPELLTTSMSTMRFLLQ